MEKINEFNSKRLERRIDLLFFPNEGKCVIVELKKPDVSAKDNVYQMDNYIDLIIKYKKESIIIDQFYTYLITETISSEDVPRDYKKIYGVNSYVRKNSDIQKDNKTVANQYSEIISYTDIYKRALSRNNIFFEKLNKN